jgi:hypothetical protein
VHATRDEARRQEAARRRPHSDLLSMTPAVSAQVERRPMHQLAHDIGERHLRAAREKLAGLTGPQRAQHLRDALRPMLGDIDPAASPRAEVVSRRALSTADVEAVSLAVEDGIDVPMLLLMPKGAKAVATVVAVSQGGKERFLAHRSADLEALLRAGMAVCLADVRGTGETAPAQSAGENNALNSLAQREFDLGRSLLGSRLKDVRTVLAYLRTRPELDPRRIAVWGESFAPPNQSPLFLDEIETEMGPQIQYRADPTGAHLALLTGLYEPDVAAVAARGGLASYLSVLEDAFTYVPLDAIVLGIVKAGDISDVVSAIAPRSVLVGRQVNGRNILVDDASKAPQDVGAWLVSALRK